MKKFKKTEQSNVNRVDGFLYSFEGNKEISEFKTTAFNLKSNLVLHSVRTRGVDFKYSKICTNIGWRIYDFVHAIKQISLYPKDIVTKNVLVEWI